MVCTLDLVIDRVFIGFIKKPKAVLNSSICEIFATENPNWQLVSRLKF
jgi:hypothetical protein